MANPRNEDAFEPILTAPNQKVARTPLPKLQLSLIYYIASAETLATHGTDPFIVRLVQHTGVTQGDERKAGYYAGIIGSALCLSEALTVFHWGRASDKHGRRPILLIGAFGISLTILWFGLSSAYWSLVVSRSVQGVFNAAIGVEKSAIAELSDSTNISDAYTILAIVWSIGITVGEYIGGFFSTGTRGPLLFGGMVFFRNHPYALPCIIISALAFGSVCLAFIWLEETHPVIIARSRAMTLSSLEDRPTALTPLLNPNVSSGPGETSIDGNLQPVSPLFRDLLVPTVIRPIIAYIFQAFTFQAYAALTPLIYATSIQNGGLGLTPYEIGKILSSFGIVQFIFQVFCVAPIIRWAGANNAQIIGQTGQFIAMVLYPFLNHFARKTGDLNPTVCVILAVQYLFRMMNILAYASIQVIVARSSPSSSALGSTLGLAQAVTSVARAVAPSFASSLFAFSQEHQLLGGNLVYLVLVCISFTSLHLAYSLPADPETSNSIH